MIIETAHKIINKQGNSVTLDFLQILVIYAGKRWRQVGTPCILHSQLTSKFCRTLGLFQDRTTQMHKEIFTVTF